MPTQAELSAKAAALRKANEARQSQARPVFRGHASKRPGAPKRRPERRDSNGDTGEGNDPDADAAKKKDKRSLAKLRLDVASATRAKKVLPPLVDYELREDDDLDGVRLLTKLQVMDRVGLAYCTIWTLMRQNRFPRSRALGGKSVWIQSEIEAWIASLPKRLLKPLKAETEAA